MTTNFPSSLDSFTNPSATDAMDSVTVPHADQHADVNDAVEALQAKVGVDGSADTGSLDYKVANQGLVLVKTQTVGSGVSSVTVTNPFSSTFLNYRIFVEINDMSNQSDVYLRFSGDSSSSYYWAKYYIPFSGTATVGGANGSGADTKIGIGGGSTYRGYSGVLDIGRAGSAGSFDITSVMFNSSLNNTTGFAQNGSGFYSVSSIPTSVLFYPGIGTFNGGTIRVYGYNNG